MGDVPNSRDREEKKRTWVRKGGERENWFFSSLVPTKKDVALFSGFYSGCLF